jgi:DNA polymerase-3 subunit chi
VTGIDFHFNTPDKVHYACRLLRKAVAARGARVVVVGEEALLDEIDRALWQISPVDFVAHCRDDAAAPVLSRSPVVLSARGDDTSPHHEILLNLGANVPSGFGRFERLIDIVSDDEADRQIARARWRHYADRGYAITRHDYHGGTKA